MHCYRHLDKVLISNKFYNCFHEISEKEAEKTPGNIYVLTELPPGISRKSFFVSDPSLIFLEHEGIELIKTQKENDLCLPDWLIDKVHTGEAISININYPDWEDVLRTRLHGKWKINIAGLGDVGGMLLSGLKLLGSGIISEIGIYDLDGNKIKRWLLESSQILSPDSKNFEPFVHPISIDEIFNCDMFVFCVTAGVPAINDDVKDVRLAQFESNSRIVKYYAKLAREHSFKGIFSVVSDPVDLLCRVVFDSSNTSEDGSMDFRGLAPEQIRGYGLGVMFARAAYYASQIPEGSSFLTEGRLFGPHGEGLIVANSIENYNDEFSVYLTDKTIKANIDVRSTGYKPYIAPALSSGSLSIIATIKGEWHYSSTFLGGVYMGMRNRLTSSGTEIERLNLPDSLFKRIQKTYERLCEFV